LTTPDRKPGAEPALSRVSVRLLEKDYQFACAPEERAHLLDCAEFLNSRMREIRDSGKVVGLDRVAVMAALNITDELLKLRLRGGDVDGSLAERMKSMREKVEGALQDSRQMTID
jgi:cell division protein ZapA